MSNDKKKPELLVPAGDKETFYTAIHYGADSVYIGGEQFSLRAKAVNFTLDDMRECIDFAHKFNKKVYITSNIYAHNYDLDNAKKYFEELNNIKPDAVLVSDLGLFNIAKKTLRDIDIHISTQANTLNIEAVNMYEELGAKRVVLARELSLKEIKEITNKKSDNMEIEVFVHGAMCISYSGRCLLSAFMTGRSANYGACTHPCRWKYTFDENDDNNDNVEINGTLIESERPNDKMPVIENERGTYIFNSKDLCMIEHIDDLMDANIDSFKIEGRMKTPLYVATVTRVYRKAIDDYLIDKDLYKKNIPLYKEEIEKCTYRLYTTGFFYGRPDETTQIYDNNTYITGSTFYGIIEKADGNVGYITQKNKFSINDTLTILRDNMQNEKIKVIEIYDLDKNEKVESCPHSKQKLKITFDKKVNEGEIIRS